LVALLLALLPLSGALAQYQDGPYCGTLSAEDCEILEANWEAVYTAFAYDMDAQFVIEIENEGTFSFDLTSQGALSQGAEEIDAVMDDIWNTTLGELRDLIREDEFLNRGLSLTERILRAPLADLSFQSTATMNGEEQPIPSFDLRVADGVIYITSPALTGALGLEPDTWVNLDVVEGMYMTVEALNNPEMLENLFGGMTDGVPGGDMGIPGQGNGSDMMGDEFNDLFARIDEIANAEYWDAMSTPEFMEQVFSVERLDNETVNGVEVAVFENSLDYAALVETEEFQMAFADIFELSTAMTLSEEDRAALEPVILEQLATMEFTSTVSIGLEDFYTYAYSFTSTQTQNLQAYAEALGDMSDESDLGTQTVTFTVANTITNHNETPEVEIPENTMSVMELINMMMGAGSSATMPEETPEASADEGPDIAALLPDGWEETESGVFTGPEGETLVVQTIPAPSQFVLGPTVQQAGLDEAPEPSEERDINDVSWTFYEVDQDGGGVRFALGAPSQSTTYLVLIGGSSEQIEAMADLYQSVIDALSE
jgi:hypothetical protein